MRFSDENWLTSRSHEVGGGLLISSRGMELRYALRPSKRLWTRSVQPTGSCRSPRVAPSLLKGEKKEKRNGSDESCQRVTKRLADLRGRRRGTVCAAARRMACRHRAKTVPPRAARCRCAPPPPLLKESSRLFHIALGLTSTTPQDHLALASRKSLLTALLS